MYNEELYHHGILGQRWGVRRFQNKDGTLTSEGKQHYNKSKAKSENEDSKEKGLTEQQKRNIKIGAAVAATALVAVGGVYLYKTGTLQKIGKSALNGDFVRSSKLKKIANPTKDAHKIAKAVNKKCFGKVWDTKSINNCKENALGFYLRKQLGLDAVSPPRVIDGDLRTFIQHVSTNDPESVVSKIKTNTPLGLSYKGKTAQDTATNFIKSQIAKGKYKEGDCGAFGISELGHTIAFYIENGEPKFQNIFQTNNSHKATDWFKLAPSNFEFQVCNFANLNLIMDVVENMYK